MKDWILSPRDQKQRSNGHSHIFLEILASVIRRGKEIKVIWIIKEEIRFYLVEDDRFVYMKNLRESTSDTISEFSKVSGFRINI